jgi:prepilin-type processing-associated H-X9-DG protein
MLAYVQDYDEKLFPGEWMASTDTSNPFYIGEGGGLLPWPGVLYPYVKNEKVFICPSAPSGVPNQPWNGYTLPGTGVTNSQSVQLCYGMNANLMGYPQALTERPSSTLFAADKGLGTETLTVDGSTVSPGGYGQYVCLWEWAGWNVHFVSARHSGGGNVVFMDGHAKWFKQENIIHRFSNGENHWDQW